MSSIIRKTSSHFDNKFIFFADPNNIGVAFHILNTRTDIEEILCSSDYAFVFLICNPLSLIFLEQRLSIVPVSLFIYQKIWV